MRLADRRSAERPARDVAGRPGPLKVESADPAVDVEDLASQVQSATFPRRHRGWIDLIERNATGPLIPKWVHKSDPCSRVETRPSTQTASSTSCETPDNSRWMENGCPSSSSSGANAGVVGTIVWPRLRAKSKPEPSLPDFGS